MDSATLNTIGVCSGVGMLEEGVHTGLEYLGIRSRTVVFAEREALPVSVLAARMEEGSLAPAPIWFGDFTELPARRFRGLVDGIVAGFPCQDLSVAGRRAGLDGKRSGLFFNVLDIADDSGAWFLVLENVAGIASATAAVVDEASASDYAAKSTGEGFSDVGIEDGRLLERAAARVMGELADRGWDAEWITLSASDVGASHGRARWFCLAWRVADARLQHGDLQQWRARAEHSRGSIVMDDAAQHGRNRLDGKIGCGWGVCEAGGSMGDTERARRAQAGGGCDINAGRELESGCGALVDAKHTSSIERYSPPVQWRWARKAKQAWLGGSGIWWALADTNGIGRRREGNPDQSSSWIERCGALLADTSGPRLQGFQCSGGGF